MDNVEEEFQIRPKDFSGDTTEVLSHWLTDGAEVTNDMVTRKIINEMNVYHMIESNNLYRGIGEHDRIVTENGIQYLICDSYTCFTYDPLIACEFVDNIDKVVSIYCTPEESLIDTTLLAAKFITRKCGGIIDECVVIVRPGKYEMFFIRDEIDNQ